MIDALTTPLLTPISAAQPCGESLEYHPDWLVLQGLLSVRPEVQYGSFTQRAAPIEWPQIERDARALLARSIDINLLIVLTRARTAQVGAAGLAQGLGLLLEALTTYPEHIHPGLYTEDDEPSNPSTPSHASDPTMRANALAALADPEALLGEVRALTVGAQSALRLSVRDIEQSLVAPRAPNALAADTVQQQLRELHTQGDTRCLALQQSAQRFSAIVAWAQTHLGDAAPSLAPLHKIFTAVLTALPSVGPGGSDTTTPSSSSAAPQSDPIASGLIAAVAPPKTTATAAHTSSGLIPGLADPAHTLPSSQGAGLAAGAGAGASTPLSLAQEREHMRQTLGAVRTWLETHEPSSPVAILLKQAQRLWGRRFAEVASSIPPDLLALWDQD